MNVAMTGNVSLAVVVTFICLMVLNKRNQPRRLSVFGAIVILIGVAYCSQFVLPPIQDRLREVFLFRRITEGAVFVGLFVSCAALFIFERREAPRRVPLWVGFGLGLAAMFGLPPLLDAMTGKYQDSSLRAHVNACTDGMVGQSEPITVTNTCNFPVVVGLCLSNEANPEACAQSVTIASGMTGSIAPIGGGIASLPANPNGATIVACRPPHRPSRTKNVGGRGHRGVCLPER